MTKSMSTTTFSDKLEELLFDNKIALEELATDIHHNPSMIYKYLRGAYIPSTTASIAIVDRLNTSLDYMFGLSDDATHHKTITTFATRLNTFIEQKHISKYKLSLDTKFDEQSIRNWARGSCLPNINNLITLAKYFNCSLDFIIGKDC